jgi:hypothetical protein
LTRPVFRDPRLLESPEISEIGALPWPRGLASESPNSGLESLDWIGPMYMVSYI